MVGTEIGISWGLLHTKQISPSMLPALAVNWANWAANDLMPPFYAVRKNGNDCGVGVLKTK